MAWRCLHWQLRTGSRAVGTEPYRTTTCPVVWAAGLVGTGSRIYIGPPEAGCSVEDAGVGPRKLCGCSVIYLGAQHASWLPGSALWSPGTADVPSVVDVADLKRTGEGYVPRYAL